MLRLPLLLAALTAIPAAEYPVAPAPPGEGGALKHVLARAGHGDVVLLARGATYRENAGLEFRDGVTVKAVGPADLPPPFITTSVVVPALKPWDRNPKVLTAKVDKPVLECYVDGRFVALARFPNQGWLRTAKGTTPDLIVAADHEPPAGAAPGRWKGAQVRWRRWSWWWETRPITDDDGKGRLALGPDGRFQDGFTGEGSAFCVDNCLAELDAPGEWCWDAATATLYVYPPADADAKKPLVEVVVEPKGFGCGGATLEGIGFARIAGDALGVGRTSAILGCTFQDIGGNGIDGSWDDSGSRIAGCTFRDVRNVAINWMENPAVGAGTVIERNQLERVGMQFGYGGSGSWHGAGMIVQRGKGVTVRLNRVVDTGYAGIIVGAEGMTVERNVFVRCMGSLNDGAGIYVCTSGATIRENVVLDTVGNLDTSQWWYPLGHGIWTEFLGDLHDQVITANTVFGSGGNGLFLTNNRHCQVRDNVLVGNRLAGIHLGGKATAQDHELAGNTLVAMEPSRRQAHAENIPANWKGNDFARCLDAEAGDDYGRMSGTTLVASPGLALASVGGRRLDDVAGWKQAGGWIDPAPLVQRATALLLINDGEQPHDFPAPAGGWQGLDGKALGKAVKVAPFRSVVVVRAGEGAGLPPYVLASGIDYRAPAAAKDRTAKKAPGRAPRPGAAGP